MTDNKDTTAADKQASEPTAADKPQVTAAEPETEAIAVAADSAETSEPAAEQPDAPEAAEPPAAAAEPQTMLIEKPAEPKAKPAEPPAEKVDDAATTAVLPTLWIDRHATGAPRPPAEPKTEVIPVVPRTPEKPERPERPDPADARTEVLPRTAAAPPPPAPAAAPPAAPVPPPVEPAHAPQPMAAQPIAPPPVAGPHEQPFGGRQISRKTLVVAASAIGVVVLIGVIIALVSGGSGSSTRSQVTSAVNTYAKALATGDLPTLRSVTTGKLSDYYRTVPQQQFTEVYQTSIQQHTIPALRSVDAVEVTGKTAKAQFSTGDASHPGPSYSIDLTQTSDGWKIVGPQ